MQSYVITYSNIRHLWQVTSYTICMSSTSFRAVNQKSQQHNNANRPERGQVFTQWEFNSPVFNSLASLDVLTDQSTTVNILGIRWTPHNDMLHLAPTKLTNASNLVTKLQQSCKVFDPCYPYSKNANSKKVWAGMNH